MQILIRRYEPSDKEAVLTIYRDAIEEHINPTFMFAMTQPLYITISLFIYIGSYVMSGQSVILALISGGAWVGLIYFCCYEFYSGYVRERLQTDMKDISGHFLSHPDNCFWVAEAEMDGRPQILGMVAVESKNDGDGKKYGELLRMNVSSSCRRIGLAKRLAKTVEDFCRERGFWKIILSTSSTQRAAEALYYKMGFKLTLVNTQSECPQWMVWMTRAKILYMEKVM
ncbi:N-acetyltransferase family 8 member 3-like [Triplophysa dalaica]|uniref:N-acetyltransferase family 8 member 3-like n=1 Tax=Triplophysa dalaica TaxID=1582913 RepID=UPI0024DF6AE0|nr:N-acetyltransferase family 8 member 3-like [Triplophysa dalaica]